MRVRRVGTHRRRCVIRYNSGSGQRFKFTIMITTGSWLRTAAGCIRRFRRNLIWVLVAWCMLLAAPAVAALQDEIQVYTDDINKPGEAGLELHVNTTPRGRTTPDYPGEITPERGVRFTPEFSYGLTDGWEAGFYLPALRTPNGEYDVAGAKLRLKWLPVRGDEARGGWFAGGNLELSRLAKNIPNPAGRRSCASCWAIAIPTGSSA